MKQRVLLLIIIIILCAVTVDAVEYKYSYDEINGVKAAGEWERIVESLPEYVREEVENIDLMSPTESTDAVIQKTSLGYWLGKLNTVISETLGGILKNLFPLYSLVLFMAAVNVSFPKIISPAMVKAFQTYAKLVAAILMFELTSGVIEKVSSYLSELCGIMNTLTPLMEIIYIAGGALTQGAVSTQAVMLFITIIGNFNGKILMPLTRALFLLSAVSMVCEESNLGGFVCGLRKWIMRLIQLMSIFFSFILGAQSVLARSADTLAMKTARFAIGSFIPMAGGMISEAFSTITQGISVIRSVAGIGGILIILLILLRGIVPILITRFGISIATCAAEMIKISGLDSMLKELQGIVELLLGVALYTSLMFFLSLIIFARSQGA